MIVKSAIIQNISVEAVTITSDVNGAIGLGIILNPAIAGQGGGVLVVSNMNLKDLYYSRASAGATLSIYREM